MKKVFITLAAAVLLLSSFKVAYDIKTNTAEVETVQGLHIFYRSKPASTYTHLGTYQVKFVLDDKPALLLDKIIRKVKDRYPTASGVIIDTDMTEAQAISF